MAPSAVVSAAGEVLELLNEVPCGRDYQGCCDISLNKGPDAESAEVKLKPGLSRTCRRSLLRV